MPPGKYSRHLLCDTIADPLGKLFLADRSRYFYRELADNRFHSVVQGDTLFDLAGVYFAGVERPAGLFWVIADFQPTPIHDPTVVLEPGRVLVIPSLRTVLEEILNPNRTPEFTG